eukprot:CAMPEP_0197569096 /NCGR_PEP_ID=MMETSP1320-20131121/38439_1 /TAXON_ID=91990 /ORGANISM="Bolidomonas sp., Strain RCC2347" /LENGTH=71 /DNA_ID=CAMNT_0043131425 /DNA_START=1 /DNA_END=212 /DNA_ORIENTATION=+
MLNRFLQSRTSAVWKRGSGFLKETNSFASTAQSTAPSFSLGPTPTLTSSVDPGQVNASYKGLEPLPGHVFA